MTEREGTWGELGVGSVIVDPDGQQWEVVAAAMPQQYGYGRSNWLRLRGSGGEEHAIAPRPLMKKVMILRDAPERSWPDGAREAALLVEALGAVEIGTQDKESGEVWCPTDSFSPEESLTHLQLAHGIDTTGITDAAMRATIHGRCHDQNDAIGKHGFPHRHLVDLSIIKA